MPSARRRSRRPVVVGKRAVVHQAEVEAGGERVRAVGGHLALGGHARVTERVGAADRLELEAADEVAREAGLLVDLDRLARAHHAQLGIALAQPLDGALRVGLHHDHRVARPHLGLAGAERVVERRADPVPVLLGVGGVQRDLAPPRRHAIAVERHAGAVGAAIAELEEHRRQVVAQRILDHSRLAEETRYSTHANECRQGYRAVPMGSREQFARGICALPTLAALRRTGTLAP